MKTISGLVVVVVVFLAVIGQTMAKDPTIIRRSQPERLLVPPIVDVCAKDVVMSVGKVIHACGYTIKLVHWDDPYAGPKYARFEINNVATSIEKKRHSGYFNAGIYTQNPINFIVRSVNVNLKNLTIKVERR